VLPAGLRCSPKRGVGLASANDKAPGEPGALSCSWVVGDPRNRPAYIGWMRYPRAKEMKPIAAATMPTRRVKMPPLAVRVVTIWPPWTFLLPGFVVGSDADPRVVLVTLERKYRSCPVPLGHRRWGLVRSGVKLGILVGAALHRNRRAVVYDTTEDGVEANLYPVPARGAGSIGARRARQLLRGRFDQTRGSPRQPGGCLVQMTGLGRVALVSCGFALS
jgi:hypothetical protein